MAILKTDAVVLKGWKMGETSKILSLYTQDYGKIKVVVKGGRGQRCKYKSCLESLSHIRVVYYDKKSRDLQLLSQVDLIDPHFHIIGDLERTALALAVAELIYGAVVGEEPFPPLFTLLIQVLNALDKGEGFLEGFLWFFNTKFMDLMGYKPTWNSCLWCQGSLGRDGGYFQPESGGLVCNRCGATMGGLVVSGDTLEILYWLQRTDIESVSQLEPSLSQKAEIRKMFDLYFKTHIEHMKEIKALSLFYNIK